MKASNQIVAGVFFGADLEPGTFHGGKIEPGIFHTAVVEQDPPLPPSDIHAEVDDDPETPTDPQGSVPPFPLFGVPSRD